MELSSAIQASVATILPGGRVVEVRELPGGVSAHVCSVEVESAEGERRRYVVRQPRAEEPAAGGRSAATTEFAVLRALRTHGFPVPEALHLDDSAPATAPFFVMEAIDGSTEVAASDLGAALREMADFLARLHALDPDVVDAPGLAPLEDPLVELPRYLPTNEPGEAVRAAISAGQIDVVRNGPALIHGDYWPGNVLWQEGRLAAVIDWEDCAIGDPLADLACARVELLCQYGDQATEDFTAHYLRSRAQWSTSPRLDSLPLWEAYVSAAALSSMSSWGLDPAEERRRRGTTEQFFARAATDLLGTPRR